MNSHRDFPLFGQGIATTKHVNSHMVSIECVCVCERERERESVCVFKFDDVGDMGFDIFGVG